jgi:hypothetical protein
MAHAAEDRDGFNTAAGFSGYPAVSERERHRTSTYLS